MRAAAGIVLLSAALLGSGCAVDQRKEVGAYRDVLDLGPVPRFSVGAPLSLRDAALLTNAVNERLSMEGENYLQALIDLRRRAAALQPTLDLFGALTVRENAGSSGSSGGDGGSSNKNVLFDGGVNAQYTLLTGLSDFRRIDAAELAVGQRRWLLLDLRESLLLETARTYYSVVLAERQVEVLRSSLGVQEERLRNIRGRQQVGFARPLDVAQIESQVSQTRVLLLDAGNAVRTARSALAFATGAQVRDSELTDGFEPGEAPGVDSQGFLEVALANRQDLAAAIKAAGAARSDVDAQIGRYYPTVTVNLDYFLTRDTLPTDRDWSGLLSIRFPIFSAGVIDADVRDAWSRFRQTVLEYSLTKRAIQRDVEIAAADLAATRARVEELRTQVRAAEESLRQAEAAYSAGLGTNLERIAAQDQVLSSELRLTREEVSAKIAYLVVMRAAGGLAPALAGGDLAGGLSPKPEPAPESPFIVLPSAPAKPKQP